jgi:WD40 repeat protein
MTVDDPVPFALLARKLHFAIRRILQERPHILTALELLRAGCTLYELQVRSNYSKEELLCHYRSKYKHKASLRGHLRAVNGIVPLDNFRFASVADDGYVRVWDATSGAMTFKWIGHDWMTITCIAGLHDGSIVTGGDNDKIKRWDPTTGKLLVDFQISENGVFNHDLAEISTTRRSSSAAAISTDGGRNSSTEVIAEEEQGGHMIFVCNSGLVLKIIDTLTGKCERTLTGHSGRIETAIQLSDGRIVSGSSDEEIRIWDPARRVTDECTHVLKKQLHYVETLVELTNGCVASGGAGKSPIVIWDVGAASVSATNKKAYTAVRPYNGATKTAIKSNVTVADLHGFEETKDEIDAVSRSLEELSMTRDGNGVGCGGCTIQQQKTNEGNNTFGVLKLVSDAPDVKVVQRLGGSGDPVRGVRGCDEFVWALCVLSDGVTLAAAGDGGEIKLWDTTSGALVRHLRRNHCCSSVPCELTTSFGSVVGCKSGGTGITRTGTVPGAVIHTHHNRDVFALAVLSDGYTIATGNSDGSIDLWTY